MKAVLRVILTAPNRGSMSARLPIEIEFTPTLDSDFENAVWHKSQWEKSKKPTAIDYDHDSSSFDVFMGFEVLNTRDLMEQRAEEFQRQGWEVNG